MDEKNKKLLPRATDRVSFLYIEKARIEQTEYSVQIIQGVNRIEVPIASISCLFLGPGVSITHRAVQIISDAGCSIYWMGESGCALYANGKPLTNSSKNLLRQMSYHENNALHLQVIRTMYAIRYPGEHLKSKTLDELRGIEGTHVRNTYIQEAKKAGINWNGRKYDSENWNNQDTPNKYLTSLNHMLYAIIETIIIQLGYSPAIGFIHTGKMESFVYDIADLFKERYIIPAAFEVASSSDEYDRIKALNVFRNIIINNNIINQTVKALDRIFNNTNDNEEDVSDLQLWDYKNFIKSGKNYGNKP